MTFTVIARDQESGALGIGIATYSLAVGASCPYVRPGAGAVSTQAYTNPDLGPKAIEMLADGMEPQAVLVRLARMDQDHFGYRQVGIVAANGEAAVHHGRHIRNWAGHVIGSGFIVMGNVLASNEVVQAMANAYEHNAHLIFAERLLATLDAGRLSGGQMGGTGTQLPERSAALLIRGDTHDFNLRVDAHESAVEELRRVYDGYAPFAPFYEWRQRDPANAPTQEEWAKRIRRS